jgi:hypothetical protein
MTEEEIEEQGLLEREHAERASLGKASPYDPPLDLLYIKSSENLNVIKLPQPKTFLTIHPDGRFELGPDATPSEAAQAILDRAPSIVAQIKEDAAREALKARDSELKVHVWFPVSECLPEHGQHVLAYTSWGSMKILSLYKLGDVGPLWVVPGMEGTTYPIKSVESWMHLPKVKDE